ncbi:MAG: acyl-CoA reductase [Flammeovirgaceae bacterium]|nr:acyl-CoA reductase [Flammeovirgaceae bacterium]
MTIDERISAFIRLGESLKSLPVAGRQELQEKIENQNVWFTKENVDRALSGIISWLIEAKLQKWISSYQLAGKQKTIGIVMAGNIPLVGFHDLMCVLLSGHKAKIKVSSSDSVLTNFIIDKLIELEPRFKDSIETTEFLKHVEGIIATGSDNSSRYFEYYFRSIPHIIRKNRSSCAILMGEEDASSLQNLALDVFSYFGLGCRNISKLFVPEGFPVESILKHWDPYQTLINHHKYANNYDYHKSILLMNQIPFFDNNFILLTKNTSLVSPLANLYYENYSHQDDLKEKLNRDQEKIQCMVSAKGWYNGSVEFGQAQSPEINDYSDNIDTMSFLAKV